MNADTATQLRLLDLQATDTALAQLAIGAARCPNWPRSPNAQRAADAAQHAVVEARTLTEDIALEQRRLENDVDTVRTRTTRDEARLQAGGLPARELAGLQHEIATLARRQSTLEDELLDVMERAEQADATLGDATARREALAAELAELEAARDAAFAEIDAAIAQRTPRAGRARRQRSRRPARALRTGPRAQGGTGAALLRQRRCEGCHMELSGSELAAARAAAPDAVVRCDNCRAILVRTAESGL